MSIFALKDCEIFVNQFDLAADLNDVSHLTEYAELDKTNYASAGNKEYLCGLASTTVDIAGFLNTATGQSEPVLRALQGTTGNVITWSPDGAANSAALFCRGLKSKVSRGGKVGDIMPISAHAVSNAAEGVCEGYLILPKSTLTTTGNATGYQDGAVAATETLYAALHVFSVAGTGTPTLTAKIQSDDNAGFSSATDRITFTAATAVGVELKSLAGAITDDYWRVAYTISGSSPQFSCAVAIAIV